MPIYFSQEPVLSTRAGGGFGRGGPPVSGVGADITPNAVPIKLSPYDTDGDMDNAAAEPKGLPSQADDAAATQRALGGGGGGGGRNPQEAGPEPRVVMQFPMKPDQMLLSGELAGGQTLSGRALAIDQPLGQGHVVMFALRPFWRWQTQGTYALGFNTIINWDHLDAGKQEHKRRQADADDGEAAAN
jgi:hypothetical protein